MLMHEERMIPRILKFYTVMLQLLFRFWFTLVEIRDPVVNTVVIATSCLFAIYVVSPDALVTFSGNQWVEYVVGMHDLMEFRKE